MREGVGGEYYYCRVRVTVVRLSVPRDDPMEGPLIDVSSVRVSDPWLMIRHTGEVGCQRHREGRSEASISTPHVHLREGIFSNHSSSSIALSWTATDSSHRSFIFFPCFDLEDFNLGSASSTSISGADAGRRLF
jgi:hypothetical protein